MFPFVDVRHEINITFITIPWIRVPFLSAQSSSITTTHQDAVEPNQRSRPSVSASLPLPTPSPPISLPTPSLLPQIAAAVPPTLDENGNVLLDFLDDDDFMNFSFDDDE